MLLIYKWLVRKDWTPWLFIFYPFFCVKVLYVNLFLYLLNLLIILGNIYNFIRKIFLFFQLKFLFSHFHQRFRYWCFIILFFHVLRKIKPFFLIFFLYLLLFYGLYFFFKIINVFIFLLWFYCMINWRKRLFGCIIW